MAKAHKTDPPQAEPISPLHARLLEAVHDQQSHDHDDGKGTKHPAPSKLFDALGRWARDLGLDWVAALKEAGIKRTVAKAIRDGTAGWPTEAKIEDVLTRRARATGRFTTRMQLIEAWADLGYAIATERPDLLADLLGAARHVYEREKASRPPPGDSDPPPPQIEGLKRRRNR